MPIEGVISSKSLKRARIAPQHTWHLGKQSVRGRLMQQKQLLAVARELWPGARFLVGKQREPNWIPAVSQVNKSNAGCRREKRPARIKYIMDGWIDAEVRAPLAQLGNRQSIIDACAAGNFYFISLGLRRVTINHGQKWITHKSLALKSHQTECAHASNHFIKNFLIYQNVFGTSTLLAKSMQYLMP